MICNLKNSSTSIFIIIYAVDETMPLTFIERFSCAMFSAHFSRFCRHLVGIFLINFSVHNQDTCFVYAYVYSFGAHLQWPFAFIDLDVVKSNRFRTEHKVLRHKNGFVSVQMPYMHLMTLGCQDTNGTTRTTPIRPLWRDRYNTVRVSVVCTSLIIVWRWSGWM